MKFKLVNKDYKCVNKILNLFLVVFLMISQFNFLVAQEFEATYYTSKDGISIGHHGYIVQDKNGIIWSSSQGGLTRFDGSEFEIITYDKTNKRTLNVNEQTPLFVSRDSMLWIGSFDGLVMYDQKNDVFKFWGEDEKNIIGPSIPELTSIVEDENGMLWIACYGGIYSFDRKENKWTYFDPLPEELYIGKHHSVKSIRVIKIDKYDKNILWLGGMSKIFKFDISKRKFIQNWIIPSRHNFNINTFALFQKNQFEFYLGTYGSGLQLFNSKTGQTKDLVWESDIIIHEKPFKIVRDIIRIDSVRLLCTNFSGHLFIYNESTKSANSLPNIHVSKRAFKMIKDNDDNIWIASAEGITKIKPKYVNIYSPSNDIKKYDIWNCSYDNINNYFLVLSTSLKIGFEVFSKSSNKYVNIPIDLPPNEYRFSFDSLTESFLIIDKNRLLQVNKNNTKPSVVFELKNDNYNDIKSTKAYIYLYNKEQLDIYNRSGDLVKSLILPKELLKEKKFTIGSYFKILKNDGLYYLTMNEILKCNNEGDFISVFYSPSMGILDFFIFKNKVILLTRTGLKKCKINSTGDFIIDGKFVNPYKSMELRSLNIVGDVMYMRNMSGIVGYNYKTNERVFRVGETDDLSTVSRFFHFKNKLFGHTPKKFFDIDLLIKKEKIYDIKINDLLIPGYELKKKNNEIVNLNFEQNSLSLSWNTVYFGDPSQIKYSYKLIGLNEDWIQNDNLNRVNFNNLKTGKYTLRIKAMTIGGNFEKNIFSFVIIPPWWKSWWFYLISLVILSLLIYYFNKYRIQQINAKSRHKQELAELELNALRAQMNPHFIFNSLNSIKRLIQKEDSINAIDYLTNFSFMIRQILFNSDKKLISLKEEIDFCIRYLDMEKLRFQDKFSYEIRNIDDVQLDNILISPLMLQPYLENALWHGIMHKKEKGILILNIKKKTNFIQIEIDDNGIGRLKAKEFSKSKIVTKKSRGLELSEKRGELSKILFNQNIEIEIIDKFKDGISLGTKVNIKIFEN